MIIEHLRKVSSMYDKTRILSKAPESWATVFNYTYDKDKVFRLRFDIDNSLPVGEPNELMFGILDEILARGASGNSARLRVDAFAQKHGTLIKLICNKDLNAGINVKLINKVFPGLIPEFKLQLAKDVPLTSLKFPQYAQVKFDGVRVVAIITKTQVIFKTRNGKTFEWPAGRELLKDLARDSQEIVLDGELVIREGLSVHRTIISGLVNSAIHGTPITNKDVIFQVFDFVAKESFDRQVCNYTYKTRLEQLDELFSNQDLVDQYTIKQASVIQVNSINEANILFENVLRMGFEGLILKSPNHLIEYKRSSVWAKLKAELDTTLTCNDVEYGAVGTKYEGLIGALVCSGIVEGKPVKVKVGSGLSDYDRSKCPTAYIGKKIDVIYNSVIQDTKTLDYSLFLPRYIVVRGDI